MADGLLNKASIILTPTGYKAGTLYNVAPVLEPYEDFDFARASVASRVNSSGLVEMVGRTLGSELVTDGDFPTPNINWSLTNATIETDGARINNTVIKGFSGISQLLSGTLSNKQFILTYDVVATNGQNLVLDNGTSLTLNTSTTGVGKELYFEWTRGDNYLVIKRAVPDTDVTIDNVSLKELIDTNNIPRISYDSNGDNGHILLEPTSTNLITYSEDFSDSSWNLDFAASYITRTPNAATSPSGENNATKLIANDTSRDPTNSYIGASTSASAPYSASIFAKKAEYDYLVLGIGSYGGGYYAIFNLSNGTISTSPTASGTTASIEDYGNGWYRCIITTTNTSGSEVLFTTPSVDGTLTTDYTNTTNGVYVWGAQLEELSYATSYIPTYGSTETRATETATGAGSADLINSTEGVLYAEIAALNDDSDIKGISLGNLGTNVTTNGVAFYFFDNNLRARAYDSDYTLNGGIYFEATKTSINTNTFYKVAISWDSNGGKMYVDGALITPTTNLSGYGFAANYFNSLNFYRNSNDVFEGKCKALAVFNEALSDSELTQLTT